MHRKHLEIVDPCTERWADMPGTSMVRHCAKCSKSVYNISMLTEREAEVALAVRPEEVCVNIHFDAHGEVVFYPEATQRRHPTRHAFAAAVAASTLAACSPRPTVETSSESVAGPPAVAVAVQQDAVESLEVKAPKPKIAHDLRPPQHIADVAPPEHTAPQDCDEPEWNGAFKDKDRSADHLRNTRPKPGGLRRRYDDGLYLNPYSK